MKTKTNSPARNISKLKLILVSFLICIVSTSVVAYWGSVANDRGCGGVGLGISVPCDSVFYAFDAGLAIAVILATIFLHKARISFIWLLLIFPLQITVYLAGVGIVDRIRSNHSNTVALKQLNQSIAKEGFPIYLPKYLPPGFYHGNVDAENDNLSIDYSRFNNEDYVSIDISNRPLSSVAKSYFNVPNICAFKSCTYIGKNNFGDAIYVGEYDSGLGQPYFTVHQNILIELRNDNQLPISQTEILRILSSLELRSVDQLQQLNNN